jgi:hypothetical protein
MLLSVLFEKLKIDTGQSSLPWNTARRGFERGATQVNKDLKTAYEISGSTELAATISPDPTKLHEELLLILAAHFLANIDLVTSSKMVTSWKSGDKQIDRSRQLLTKKEIKDDLWALYRNLAGLDDDPAMVAGEAYEQGSEVE